MIIIALSTVAGNGRNYINYSKYSAEIITCSLTPMAYLIPLRRIVSVKDIIECISMQRFPRCVFSRHYVYDIMAALSLQLSACRMQ